ncbi:MAG TPA: glutamate mutase L [Solirubrobacterales bacterium]|nr:glutamate mutase L [Solirubrobacterales bacterium]
MGLVALADFGSTYTKLTLVDPDRRRVVGRAQAPTSIATDVMDGYAAALAAAREAAGGAPAPVRELAVSSAGGGLRVAAVGLVADLTAAAARQAALNAGARVDSVLSGRLEEGALAELRAAAPEILLFAGGTDGGQRQLVLDNARRLAAAELAARVVVACNREVADEVAAIFAGAGNGVEVAANVMPKLGRLEAEGARAAISRAFLEHVIGGKGMSDDGRFLEMVRMPTPEAVLEATRLLASGTAGRAGEGDIVVVDVGGATTDVHSTRGERATPGIEQPLLPPPLTLRTVEGDLGLRAGAAGAVDADRAWLAEQLGEAGSIVPEEAARERGRRPGWIPDTAAEAGFDALLAVGCATQALARHCGTMLLAAGEKGPPTLIADGPDLREAKRVIGTGGVFAHREDGAAILARALGRRVPRSLTPLDPVVSIDRGYVLAAVGLLAGEDPDLALAVLESELDKN